MAIIVLVFGVFAAERVLGATGMHLATYVLLVLGAAAAAPWMVRSWPHRHPDLCAYCHGRGSTTFVAARRLRTRQCFFCRGTGRIGA
ncbi:hypothetical protein SAMN05443668_1205 [Cryptosporangium aurantiacum]|uniref:Uncharacterized protein n=1 Tax=Cryptosporangium aurantiacum TaxID=134849 RepID=A0A1M7RLI9_9ACTN|nr:hypothetical protein SAMN05443668_1205 [Cryptosporangium aurantiacum]